MQQGIENLLTWEPDVLSILSNALANNLITDNQRESLKKQYTTLFNILDITDQLLRNDQPLFKVLNSLRRANNAHNLIGKQIAKISTSPPVPALNSNGPDFYKANRSFCLTVSNCPKLSSTDISINNPYSSLGITPIKPDSVVMSDLGQGKKKLCMTTGESMGGATVTVNACGSILSRLIFNYGDNRTGATGSGLPVSIKDYSGTCTGSYSGAYTAQLSDGSSDTGPLSGSVAATLHNGLVSITAPAAGSGRLSSNGITNVKTGAFGSIGMPGISVRWNGSAWIAAKNYSTEGVTATASGSWSTKFNTSGVSGSASGGWNVSCK